jgi:hypothetical protein
MLYRLLTENKNYEQIKKLVCEYFDGTTIIKADGIWHGKSEHSLIIEISGAANYDMSAVSNLCFAIKKLNQQDKILVQRIECESKLV